MVKQCPCKGCVPPKRNEMCHSTCNEYKEWKDFTDKRKEELKSIKESENRIRDFKRNSIEKAKRAHRW